MMLDKFGFYQPTFDDSGAYPHGDKIDLACPFLVPKWNEDALSKRFLPIAPNSDHKIGQYHDVFAAHVEEGGYRRSGSSGGMGSWLAVELLKRGLVDGVIHARFATRHSTEDPFFLYGISRNVDEVVQAAHSHYHVVEISGVLTEVKRSPGRYLFIGVPCMIKAVRRVQLIDPDIAERIAYTMALICGHLKSVQWALSLGWGAGVTPAHIGSITFRVKSENVSAKAYYFGVKARSDEALSVHDSASLCGGKFNLGAMMPEACNYCDDVVGETADLTIGDAWLPRYAFDWRGKNMMISRNPTLSSIIKSAANEGRVVIEPMTASEAAAAQDGGFRQRREGLAYRLKKLHDAGLWAPVKRALPDMVLPGLLRARIYDARAMVSRKSRISFRKALDACDLKVYEHEMDPLFKQLRRLEVAASIFRILSIRVRALVSRRRS